MTLPNRTVAGVIACLVALAFAAEVARARTQATNEPAQPAAPQVAYDKIPVTDPDVPQAAVKVALAQRKDKNIDFKLDSIVSAERQHITGFNMRLCLSMSNRGGTTELARVVLSRNTNKKWSVATWSWGSCSR